jgi:hypothetical protein
MRVLLLCAVAALSRYSVQAASEPLGFAGFHRDMDLATLLDRYPRSSHEFSPRGNTPPQTSQQDGSAWIRQSLRSGSGTYIVRIAPAEMHDHLYYVQTEVRAGITDRLWLLFEKPAEPASRQPAILSMESRYPPCSEVLGPLSLKYGPPQERQSTLEEALESFPYVWTNGDEKMTLECGRYQGRRARFAIGLTFEKSDSRRP